MNILEQMEKAKAFVPTTEQQKELVEKINKAIQEMDAKSASQECTQAFLNRVYSI